MAWYDHAKQTRAFGEPQMLQVRTISWLGCTKHLVADLRLQHIVRWCMPGTGKPPSTVIKKSTIKHSWEIPSPRFLGKSWRIVNCHVDIRGYSILMRASEEKSQNWICSVQPQRALPADLGTLDFSSCETLTIYTLYNNIMIIVIPLYQLYLYWLKGSGPQGHQNSTHPRCLQTYEDILMLSSY